MEPFRRRRWNVQDNSRTRCRWCRKSYSSAGTYSNHVQAKHPERLPELYESRTSQQAEVAQGAPTFNEFTPNLDHGLTLDSDHEMMDEEPEDIEDIEDIGCETDNNSPSADKTDELFPPYMRAGESVASIQVSTLIGQEYYPFKSPVGYKLARFFVRSKIPKSMVAEYFKDGLGPATMEIGFKSGYTLHKLLDQMVQTPSWDRGEVDFRLQKGVEFFLRDIILSIRYLVSQPAFSSHMTWEPVRAKAYDGSRVYSELNTGDWWWEKQVT